MAPRKLAVAYDYSPGSKLALAWTLENIAREHDTLVIVIVNKKETEEGYSELWEEHGSPLIPLNEVLHGPSLRKYGLKHDEELVEKLQAAEKVKKVTAFAKVYWGDAKEKLISALGDECIDSLIVGSRGLGSVKRVLLGSVSSYVVNNANVPVTVVKS